MNFIKLYRNLPQTLFLRKTNSLNFQSCGSPCFMSTVKKFEEAKVKLNSLPEEPANDVKLKIYALFKQASQGSVQTKRPGLTDFVGRAKWDAWKAVENLSQEKAQEEYINLIDSLAKEQGASEPAVESTSASVNQFKDLIFEVNKGVCTIKLNRPNKKNALSVEIYEEFVQAMDQAAKDPKTIVTVVTGSGDYFSSGNDLANFMNVDLKNLQEYAKVGQGILTRFVGCFIDFPKPLIAVVNGPAVGIAATTLALYDAVYATDKATFHTPFSSLGQSPEGCSSYTFPLLMGLGKASEILLFNKKITAAEAYERNLVTRVFPDASFQGEVWPLIEEYVTYAPKSMIYSKTLMRALHKENLHKTNKEECDRLVERWTSDDCMKAVTAFFSKKK